MEEEFIFAMMVDEEIGGGLNFFINFFFLFFMGELQRGFLFFPFVDIIIS